MQIQIGNKKKVFNLQEASELLPMVQSVTRKQQQALAPLQLRLKKMLSNDPRRKTVELEYESVVSSWRTKIEALGAQVAGLWMVEFDVGDGLLAWRYPELSLSYFRGSQKTFAERVKLTEYLEETDPDWAH